MVCVHVTGRTPSQHRNQSFEEHDDGCVDEVNDVGVEYSCSKPMGRESDSFFGHSNLPPKRSALSIPLIFFHLEIISNFSNVKKSGV